MDIGTESSPYVIEPLEHPVPGKEIAVPSEPAYAPDEAPVPRERETVPA